MAGKYEEASALISKVEDPRKRAFLSFGMKTALMDEKVTEVDPEFDVHRLLTILSKMFEKPKVIDTIVNGSLDDLTWFSQEPRE
ncbi:hypothetical protein ENSA5_26320 [Enhygromyxa salina]|uniref:Uncharacterized protein n=1 Tax=Enhygromyxa salina TaxID=215803 RepID=A0A2S9YAP3_9BACT|nr:hypothetical protein [Enhygromyxa salina]PRQ02173.1 hypothetical protein ENSA5_26320 [Enhygromyxa salina]